MRGARGGVTPKHTHIRTQVHTHNQTHTLTLTHLISPRTALTPPTHSPTADLSRPGFREWAKTGSECRDVAEDFFYLLADSIRRHNKQDLEGHR